jgi:hypothetical protein
MPRDHFALLLGCRAPVWAKTLGKCADKSRAAFDDASEEKFRLAKGALAKRTAINTIDELGNGDRKVGL